MAIHIAPSLLAADFGNLATAIQKVNASSASLLHLDVMDGIFVPNISFGTPVIEAVYELSEKPLDIHLMITDPDRYLPTYAAFKPEYLTIHAEAATHLHRSIQLIKSFGIKAGVAINPHTPITQLSEILNDVDLICVMSVNPGFGGQQFIENTYQKVQDLKTLIANKQSNALIEIDGGVTKNNASKLARCGADILVAGSSVFNTPNISEAIEMLHG